MAFNREQHREYELKRYHRIRQFYIEQFGGKCVKCGSVNDLQFDHIDPALKEFCVSKLWSHSREKREKELAKCQLLCVVCHDEKTHGKQRAERKHGTFAMYNNAKCRCEICKEHFNAYRREWRAKQKLKMRP